jgi:ligand-binding sensor domain-containing protein/signal transduction histidine kinase/ActR/RegA family two-component response regulator
MCARFFSPCGLTRKCKNGVLDSLFLLQTIGVLVMWVSLMTCNAVASPEPPHASAMATRWGRLANTLFQNYTADNGLPNAVVTAIAEDGDGFLWIGTQGGLARWDGYHFHAYVPDPKDPGSLPDNWILALRADRQGRLWVGTQSGGLARYDREHDRFIRFSVDSTDLSKAMIRDIVDDASGGLWIATSDGLDRFDQNTGAFNHFRHDDQDPDSLPGDRVTALLQDRLGTMWIGTTKGLVRRDDSVNRFVTVHLPGYDVASIVKLCESSDGRLWIGTKKGAYVLDPQSGVLQAVQPSDSAGASLSTDDVRAIVETGQGEVWLGTVEDGIYAVDMTTLHVRRLQHDPKLATSLADDNIWALYKDRAGLLWVGTNFGLGRQDPTQSAVLTLFDVGNVGSILPTPNGLVWFGIGNNGVDVIDPNVNRVISLRADPTKPETALQKGVISALATAPTGEVYLGAGHDLYRSNASATRLARIALPPDSTTNGVQTLYFDGARLWIGSVSDGLWTLDLGSAAPSGMRADGADKLSDRRITVIEPGRDGSLWIGTRNGLNRYDPITHRVDWILPKSSEQNVPTGLISSLLTDRQGRLWVGTMGSGIHILEARDAAGLRFHRLGTTEGLPNTNVDKLLMDSSGRIWASTDDGIAVINTSTFAIRALRRMDGVAISGYWFGSGAVTSQGELLFGGPGGLTVVRPDRLKEWTYHPSVVVTDVQIGGKTVPGGRFNGTDIAVQHAAPLLISPNANSLAVEFSALDYSAPEHNRYAYRLEGYDKDWIDTDPARRLAAYTNLPPGDYRLHLRGSNRNGVWSGNELTLPIRVQPDWYQTWWFRGVEVIILGVIILVSNRIWTYRLTLQRNALEEEVKRRTVEVVQQKKLVEQKNGLIEQKVQELETSNDALALANQIQAEQKSELTRFLAVASHDLRQPMHALNIYLEALLDVELSEAAKPLAGNVQQCAHIMDGMFKALLDLSRLDAHVVKPRIESFRIASVLGRLEIEFSPQAAVKGLALNIEASTFWVESDAALVEQILRNLIANAVRYTEHGAIRVTCSSKDKRLLVAVQDTGIGISPHQQKTAFEEFCQLGIASRDRSKGLGLGLAIVRRLCTLLDSPITLISALGQGSTFTIDLPLTQNMNTEDGSRVGVDISVKEILRNKLIVLIDDEESILDAMRTRLEQCGSTIVTAVSGREAIAKLGAIKRIPDAIVCDYRLRLTETGIEAIGALHDALSDEIPAVLITGDTAPDAIRETQASGMLVLHKPIQPGALLHVLSQICQRDSTDSQENCIDALENPT